MAPEIKPIKIEYGMQGYVSERLPTKRSICYSRRTIPSPATFYTPFTDSNYGSNYIASQMRGNIRSDCPVASGASGPFREARN